MGDFFLGGDFLVGLGREVLEVVFFLAGFFLTTGGGVGAIFLMP